MKLLKILLAVQVFFCVSINLYAGPASSKLSALADQLIKDYASSMGAKKTTLAVFPFTCDEKLKKQRAGFAVSELMAHRFVSDRSFDVTERSEISRLLNEQKLQASGAVDSSTAVRLGQVLGAGTILVGNLQKVDGMYQVNARLVNAETGKVIASGFAEFPVNTFESDARMYLNLVPDEQTLGIYAVYSYRDSSNKAGIATEPFGSGTVTRTPIAFSNHLAGGGLLYRPLKKLQISAECTATTGRAKYNHVVVSGGFGTGSAQMDMTVLSVAGSYVSKFRNKWGYSAGLGLQHMWINTGNTDPKKGNPPIGVFFKTGVEFKPQSRVGLGVNFKYDLSKIAVYSEYDNKILELSPLSVESVLAFYF